MMVSFNNNQRNLYTGHINLNVGLFTSELYEYMYVLHIYYQQQAIEFEYFYLH